MLEVAMGMTVKKGMRHQGGARKLNHFLLGPSFISTMVIFVKTWWSKGSVPFPQCQQGTYHDRGCARCGHHALFGDHHGSVVSKRSTATLRPQPDSFWQRHQGAALDLFNWQQ